MQKWENWLNTRVLLVRINLRLIRLPSRAVVLPLLSDSHFAWYFVNTLNELHRESFTCMPCDMAVNHLYISLTFLKDFTHIPGLSSGKPITIHPPVGAPRGLFGNVATSRRVGFVIFNVMKSVDSSNLPLPDPKSRKSCPCK